MKPVAESECQTFVWHVSC